MLGCICRQPGEIVERPDPRSRTARARPRGGCPPASGAALQRAKWAIAWERSWPHLARLLTVVGLFLVASWAGLWLALPVLGRAIGIGLFVVLTLAALLPLTQISLAEPRRGAEPARSRHRHPPSPGDRAERHAGVDRIRWRRRCGRCSASARWRRSSAFAPGCRRRGWRCTIPGRCARWWRDAGRGLYRRGRRARGARIAAAFDWNGVLAPANVRVDAWVTPPLYTSKPPIILRPRNKERRARRCGRRLPVPAGSTLIVRSSGGTLDVAVGGGITETAPDRAGAEGHQRAAFHHRRRRHRACPRAVRPAAMEVRRHRPTGAPSIALAKDPERQARGSLQMSYKLEDDYGVTEAHARFARAPASARDAGKGADKDARPRAAAAVRAAAIRAGAAECAHPQRRRPDREGSQRGSLCRRRRDADADRARTRPATRARASRSTCGCRSGCSPSRWRAR